MLKKLVVCGMFVLSLSGAMAMAPLDLLNSSEKNIKFQARHVSVGSAYEAQTNGDVFKEHLDSLNYRSAYSEDYLKLVKTYELFLSERASRDDWSKYDPVLSMVYPDSSGRKVIANIQLSVPSFYQAVIFSYDPDKNKYSMRDRFIKRIMEQNCKRLETGINRYDKVDWSNYMGFVNDLSNTITFKFTNGSAMTVLSTCPEIDWSDYKAVL